MRFDDVTIRRLLRDRQFATLFREHLGWDRHVANVPIALDGAEFAFQAVAEKRGFQVFTCAAMPSRQQLLKLDGQLTKYAREHLAIYVSPSRNEQLWVWVRREPGKPVAPRVIPFREDQSGDALIQKLESLAVDMAEEERLTLSDVVGKLKRWDVDKVTKRFYDRFKTEHTAFMKFIKGIKHEPDLQWYTSLMLNRLMFVYFIQKKRFLDDDPDYLRNRLARLRQQHGKDRFYSFYRYFLLRLFHEGLGQAHADRNAELEKLLGKVPFLNGGFFEVHDLEQKYTEIEIPDAAFEKLFSFFEGYDWHLDERPLRADNEINPDVVGYIFEKYINQKQMGAYYTKEDITEYISKNTIIPFLFDAAEKKCAIAFKPDSALWRMLRDDPDRYIYAAVRHGVVTDKGDTIPLPAEIEAGIGDVSKRGGWNKPAPQPFALPTETWREHVARRQRCLEIREKLRRGEVHQINDLITLNLDIWQFARDTIVNSEGPELLRAFYRVIAGHIPRQSNEKYERGLSVLDPTCGSGAFLFAALRILETLYSDCLERMRRFVDELDHDLGGVGVSPGKTSQKYADFKATLAEISNHPNERYFVLKNIIINNLFGVDIMEEAVEICKLRLFLKLVAQVERVEQIEPLPDIDFNIRAGNTLVGYVSLDEVRAAITKDRTQQNQGMMQFDDSFRRIEEDALLADGAYKRFRETQVRHGGTVTTKDKAELRKRLSKLDAELDRYLAGEYGVKLDKGNTFDAWKASHQPFHWLVEFFGIMNTGGFDVVIGNPPYVAVSKVDYLSPAACALRIPDLYGNVLLRSLEIASRRGRFGMIVPLSLTFSEDFVALRKALLAAGNAWFSSYDNIPAALFAGVSQRCTIWLGAHVAPSVCVTPMYRWRSASRGHLIPTISYTEIAPEDCADGIPKVAGPALTPVLRVFRCNKRGLRDTLAPTRSASAFLGFSPSARNFVSAYRDPPPCLDDSTLKPISTSDQGVLGLAGKENIPAAVVAAVGELFFHHWLTWGDGFHVTSGVMSSFVQVLNCLPDEHLITLRSLGDCLLARSNEALVFKRNAGKYVGNFNYRGHAWITRRADLTLMAGLGVPRDAAMEVFSHVQRVLAINEFAGEKSIPDAVKAKYKPAKADDALERRVTAKADTIIMQHYGISRDELEYLLRRDVAYSAGGRNGGAS